jgi:hypothetical protein
MEIPDSVAQNREQVMEFVAAHAGQLGRQGSVHAAWRSYRGRRLGPYFRLLFRLDCRQHSRYLGTDPAFAEEIRRLLAAMQAPLREGRVLARYRAQLRAALRQQKRELDGQLRRLGLYLKGSEIRGRRKPRPSARAGMIKNQEVP